MHDKLFDNRNGLGGADFNAFATELGLDTEKFAADMADPALMAMLEADQQVASRFKIRSTPSSFVNGRFVRGAAGVETYQQLIEEERAKGKALVESGTDPADVYERLLANAKTEVAG
jgi:protein-disulfide isomerase